MLNPYAINEINESLPPELQLTHISLDKDKHLERISVGTLELNTKTLQVDYNYAPLLERMNSSLPLELKLSVQHKDNLNELWIGFYNTRYGLVKGTPSDKLLSFIDQVNYFMFPEQRMAVYKVNGVPSIKVCGFARLEANQKDELNLILVSPYPDPTETLSKAFSKLPILAPMADEVKDLGFNNQERQLKISEQISELVTNKLKLDLAPLNIEPLPVAPISAKLRQTILEVLEPDTIDLEPLISDGLEQLLPSNLKGLITYSDGKVNVDLPALATQQLEALNNVLPPPLQNLIKPKLLDNRLTIDIDPATVLNYGLAEVNKLLPPGLGLSLKGNNISIGPLNLNLSNGTITFNRGVLGFKVLDRLFGGPIDPQVAPEVVLNPNLAMDMLSNNRVLAPGEGSISFSVPVSAITPTQKSSKVGQEISTRALHNGYRVLP